MKKYKSTLQYVDVSSAAQTFVFSPNMLLALGLPFGNTKTASPNV